MTSVALVLAAGSGRRLGGLPKAALAAEEPFLLAPPRGDTFVRRVTWVARTAGCARVLVVAGEPHLLATRRASEEAGVDAILLNPDPSRGMASSIAVGLAALNPAAVDVALVWPVDHPWVAPATVARILAAATRQRIVVPRHAGRGGHPTAFGATIWPELLAGHELPEGARHVVRRDPRRVVSLEVDDPGAVRDFDTPHSAAPHPKR